MDNEKNKRRTKVNDIVYIGMSAAIIAVCSWVTIPSTIPVTLQTMAIFLTAGLFGAKRSIIATVIYIILGAIGMPIFHGFTGGIGIVLGPTGGYMIGFIFTALIVGVVCDKSKGKLWANIIGMISGMIVCYIFGTIWFAIVYANENGVVSFGTILGWCVVPFLIPDGIKIAIAAVLTNRLKRFVK